MGPYTTLAVIGLFCLQGSLAVGSAENNLSFKLFVKNSSGENSHQPQPNYRDYSSYRSRNAYYGSAAPEYFHTGFGSVVPSQEQFVAAINNRTRTWKAGVNAQPSHSYMTGVLPEQALKYQLPLGFVLKKEYEPLPASFDARQKWTYCPSMNVVRNQGCCGSSYAVSAVSAMTDRWCVHSEGKEQFNFGAYDVVSCCHRCGFGCEGGAPSAVWQYWVENGITSGGAYGSHDGCQSYPFDVCKKQVDPSEAPRCMRTCQPGYNTTYAEDKHYGRVAYAVPKDEERIMYELYNFGPVQTSFTVFTDFLQYKSGVYRHAFGVRFGTHAVKVMGWGEENGVKFWLCANSWGAEWGDGGFFKFVRGEDHLGVEANVVTGLPLFR
ncbi:cathepsin B-like [Anopheles ziemanni]|uniref:cathepsin B-like n=1 Tax=Anopheles coustani TaxID=139045 RepID=UPI00265AA971|nr:cathepsin B-like [Anopheles coustani]XP_058169837.1 cathepsin B-like [Anopheles ziemanni]